MEEKNEKKQSETKVCKYCQSEIPKKAKICPNCRKKQGGKKWIIIVIVVIVLIAIASSGGGNDISSVERSTTEKQDTSNTDNIKDEVDKILKQDEKVASLLSISEYNLLDEISENLTADEKQNMEQILVDKILFQINNY